MSFKLPSSPPLSFEFLTIFLISDSDNYNFYFPIIFPSLPLNPSYQYFSSTIFEYLLCILVFTGHLSLLDFQSILSDNTSNVIRKHCRSTSYKFGFYLGQFFTYADSYQASVIPFIHNLLLFLAISMLFLYNKMVMTLSFSLRNRKVVLIENFKCFNGKY